MRIVDDYNIWAMKAYAYRLNFGRMAWVVRRGPWWGRYWTLIVERETTIPTVVK